jgi:hypothetical protein
VVSTPRKNSLQVRGRQSRRTLPCPSSVATTSWASVALKIERAAWDAGRQQCDHLTVSPYRAIRCAGHAASMGGPALRGTGIGMRRQLRKAPEQAAEGARTGTRSCQP